MPRMLLTGSATFKALDKASKSTASSCLDVVAGSVQGWSLVKSEIK